MKSDPLFPIVNFAAFYVDRIKYPRVKYRAENFLQGFDKRVKELVQYVEELLKVKYCHLLCICHLWPIHNSQLVELSCRRSVDWWSGSMINRCLARLVFNCLVGNLLEGSFFGWINKAPSPFIAPQGLEYSIAPQLTFWASFLSTHYFLLTILPVRCQWILCWEPVKKKQHSLTSYLLFQLQCRPKDGRRGR